MADYKADMHIHSKYSFDSKTNIKDIVLSAEKENIKYIAITDHVEFSNQPVNEVIDRIKRRNEEIDELQKDTNVKIIKGIEVSEPQNYIKELSYLDSIEDIDYILGSIHHILMMPIKKMKTHRRAINSYLSSMLEMVKTTDINTLAHLDYIKYYLSEDIIDEELLKEILNVIIERKIALEINTSGINRGYGLLPSEDIIKLYKNLGGKQIVIGSDAHTLSGLFSNIDEISKSPLLNDLSQGVVIKKTYRKIN